MTFSNEQEEDKEPKQLNIKVPDVIPMQEWYYILRFTHPVLGPVRVGQKRYIWLN